MQDGKKIITLDFSGDARLLAHCTPVYETLPGWQENLSECRTWQELPAAAQNYVQYIEKLTGVPVRNISVGPERSAIIARS